MILIKVVINNESKKSTAEDLVKTYNVFTKDASMLFFNVDSTGFIAQRDAKKIVNDYAVTKLPFVLLVNDELAEDEQEYAAVYSEESPITIERINEKL